ncbi:TonB-dependent receptor [Aliarcobacter butzleri]|uniref:TonB-dependent receptor n=1 Tax=Aliarcobacter butzleri TaxID=28197 RepID=UPI003AF37660
MNLSKVLTLLFLVISNLICDELENLLDDLNKYSDKKNLNIDYKPTAITVLYSSDLEVLGITTLGEALDFAAGIQTFKTTSLNSIVSVRGYTQPLNVFNEKIKYRINGINIYANYFENFPISLIERIEISRGNASILYEQSGFVAVVDIITKDKNSVTFGIGSFDNRNFSLVLNQKIDEKWNLEFDTNYLKHNKKVDAPSAITTESDTFLTTFDRDKESLEGVENFGIGATLKNENFKISSRYIENQSQNNYGFSGLLDFDDSGYNKYKVISNEIEYTTFLNSNNILESRLGSIQNNYKLNTYLYKLEPNNLGIYNPHYKVDYTQRESYLSLLLKNSSFSSHKIEYGVYASIIDIPKNKYYANSDNLTGFGLYLPQYNAYFPTQKELKEFSGDLGFINNEENKTNLSYFVSDTYDISENLTFLANIGVDDYENYNKLLNFRLGSVYSSDNINIYKLSVSQANRNPSLVESSIVGHMQISQSSNLKAEQLQSVEFMYIYQQNDERFKTNFYLQKYKNAIDGRTNNYFLEYYNKSEDDDNYGLEIEYSKNFENRSNLLFTGSYNVFKYKNKENSDVDINMPIVSKLTANIGYIYPINSQLSFSSYTRYYGKKEVLGDNEAIPEVVLFDLGAQYNISKNTKIFFNIKNILDKDYYYYGHSTKDEKMLREGRTWLTSFRYDF